jgi:hypothetical protein
MLFLSNLTINDIARSSIEKLWVVIFVMFIMKYVTVYEGF